jgi:hypothetical protein
MRKRTVEECLQLSLRRLAHCRVVQGATVSSGVLEWPSGAWAIAEPSHADQQVRLQLVYTVGLQRVSCTVPLTPRWPYFGGLSWWLCCPTCGRRGFMLYLPAGARQFGCRGCHSLTYTSCQLSHHFDALDRRLAAMLTAAGQPCTPEEVARALKGRRKLMRGRSPLPD